MLQAIPKTNPLRQHLLTEAKTIRFVVSRDQIVAHDCDLNPNMLTTKSVRGDDPTRFLEPRFTAYASPRLLSGLPAAPKWVLVPHGPLHRLPFGGLQTAVSQPLLRDNGPILVYAPSATVLGQQMGRTAVSSFTPTFALSYHGDGEQQRLRYAAAEVAAVAGLLGGVAETGGMGDKDWLRETAVSARVLHFACHGWFNPNDPLASYLEIAPNTTLSAREVLATWHIQAELVTLSACQSGVSRVLRSDEPMGLIRAFLSAGARAVLVAHWPVEDLPTFLLMRRFYEIMVETQNFASLRPWQPTHSAAQALRGAQLWLQRVTVAELRDHLRTLDSWEADLPLGGGEAGEDKRPFVHPRHWAAFTLFGL
jgi:CHAT domain-containing protein